MTVFETTIENIKKGNGKSILVADGYNRSTKKYSYYRYDDINHFGEKKKGTLVIIDPDFLNNKQFKF